MKTEEQKKHLRYSKEDLDAIQTSDGTPEWLRRAIRLALISLQRREDIVTREKGSVDLEANTINISPGQTQNYDKPVHLEIAIGSALREVLKECLA